VYEILNSIFDKDINIEELTSSIFFNIDNMCSDGTISGSYYLNKKSNIIFPHEQNLTIDEIKQKYIRRFNEFKHIILDKNNYIYFVYVSQPSINSGNFIINNNEIITNTYYHLNNICKLIKKYNKNFKILFFDSINSEQIEINEDIITFKIEPKNIWNELLPEIELKMITYISSI
jgi:hypothetical protein